MVRCVRLNYKKSREYIKRPRTIQMLTYHNAHKEKRKNNHTLRYYASYCRFTANRITFTAYRIIDSLRNLDGKRSGEDFWSNPFLKSGPTSKWYPSCVRLLRVILSAHVSVALIAQVSQHTLDMALPDHVSQTYILLPLRLLWSTAEQEAVTKWSPLQHQIILILHGIGHSH